MKRKKKQNIFKLFLNTLFKKISTMKQQFSESWQLFIEKIKNRRDKIKRSLRDRWLGIKNILKNAVVFLLNSNVNWFFVFLASFLLTIEYSLLHRLFFSIGLAYLIEVVVEKIVIIERNKK